MRFDEDFPDLTDLTPTFTLDCKRWITCIAPFHHEDDSTDEPRQSCSSEGASELLVDTQQKIGFRPLLASLGVLGRLLADTSVTLPPVLLLIFGNFPRLHHRS